MYRARIESERERERESAGITVRVSAALHRSGIPRTMEAQTPESLNP